MPGDDFLTVNVFTPEPSLDAALPVLVWFHGGAYIAGSPVSPWYDGGPFNREGIVVVTVGYRLGITGFGLLPDAPPNRAVHDWLAALRWVQANIAAFGGDPARVTIAGQSAGAGAVLSLLGIESARGLLSQAIACSPVFTQMTRASATRAMAEISQLLGVPAEASALAALPRERLDDVVWRMRNVFGRATAVAEPEEDAVSLLHQVLGSLEFSPVLDGELVKRSVVEGTLQAGADGVPLLIGSTTHEFNALVPASATLADGEDVLALESFGIGWGAATRYLRDRAGGTSSALAAQLLTDLMVRSPIAFLAERRVRTWVYDFGWRGCGEVDRGLAFHCLDLPFVWNAVGAEGARRAAGDAPESLTADVHGALVRFIQSGDPGWAPYSGDRTVRCFAERTRDVCDGYAAERLLGRAAIGLALVGERRDISATSGP